MLPWVIQISIMSLILIILVHYLYNFFKNNLTIPKTKDLVNDPNKQYNEMYDIINNTNNNDNVVSVNNEHTEDNCMKDELSQFIQHELKPSNHDEINNFSFGENTYSMLK